MLTRSDLTTIARNRETIIAIDPGHEYSAFVIYDLQNRRPKSFGKVANSELLELVGGYPGNPTHSPSHMIIEQIASYGMAVGAEVFETVFWSGRFAQAWEDAGRTWSRLKRLAVKMALCHDSRAKDSNIRAALIDRYGGKELAIGRKASPGPLYGISSDVWSALAVAVAWSDSPTPSDGLFSEASR